VTAVGVAYRLSTAVRVSVSPKVNELLRSMLRRTMSVSR
jgi:hypothetical protein